MSDTTGITQAGYSEIRDCSKDEPLTKRERFAMAAMQGLCANPKLAETPEDLLAEWAVRQADAVIEEINPTPKAIP
jgi:hypothetical protein